MTSSISSKCTMCSPLFRAKKYSSLFSHTFYVIFYFTFLLQLKLGRDVVGTYTHISPLIQLFFQGFIKAYFSLVVTFLSHIIISHVIKFISKLSVLCSYYLYFMLFIISIFFYYCFILYLRLLSIFRADSLHCKIVFDIPISVSSTLLKYRVSGKIFVWFFSTGIFFKTAN